MDRMLHYPLTLACALAPLSGPTVIQAQEPESQAVPASVSVSPDSLMLDVGETAHVEITVHDGTGQIIEYPVRLISSNQWSLSVASDGEVEALRSGAFKLTALVVPPGGYAPGVLGAPDPFRRAITEEIPVTVRSPAVTRVEIKGVGAQFYAGTSTRLRARVLDATGAERTGEPIRWSTTDSAVATVNRYGELTAEEPGSVILIAGASSVRGEHSLRVLPNPIARIELSASGERARTGDVVHFTAIARSETDETVVDAPIQFAVAAQVIDTIAGTAAPAMVDEHGRFVAEQPGEYTVFATSGGRSARKTISVVEREVDRNIRVLGRAAVTHTSSSDIWVWEGTDGGDYAVTGTWNAEGKAYFWDVTDPTNIELVDSIQVDARTINDVKVSEDGRVGILSREGASNRRNGLVILDVANPRDVSVVANYDEGLTGGVHNVYIYKDHVYALSAGLRYDIINIEDPTRPRKVSQFELDTPGHGIHDVWVHDGIAYSSQWQDGVILVDVGNGIAGGSPENPVQFAHYKYRSVGGVHTALPFKSSTGKFYVFAGDGMVWPYGFAPEEPTEPGGYIHIIDFTDTENPTEVARYQLPDAGPHNFWIENEVLYIAHYNGGLRVVDVSGELMGDLFRQGREIAKFKPYDKNGLVPNSPMTWGVMPHKGNIFFSDMNSGVWAVDVEPKQPLIP